VNDCENPWVNDSENPHEDHTFRGFHDTFVRLIAVIENTPSFFRLRSLIRNSWKWLDDRGIARIIVGVTIGLFALWFLKAIGYDLKAFADLLRAYRGKD